MPGAASTVLALIFSVALLVLSMAVSNFGPRILYRFVRDGVTQGAIGLFLASFLHLLLTFVVTRQERNRQFVPQLTLICSVALVMASFIVLVVFSHRIAMSIQTQNVVAHIVADLDWALMQMTGTTKRMPLIAGTPAAQAERDAFIARQDSEGGIVRAARTGFIQEVSRGTLLAAAERHDAGVRLLYRPGQFVMEGGALAQVLPAARAGDLEPAIEQSIRIGLQRTLKQDLEFGIAQLPAGQPFSAAGALLC